MCNKIVYSEDIIVAKAKYCILNRLLQLDVKYKCFVGKFTTLNKLVFITYHHCTGEKNTKHKRIIDAIFR